jgi:ribosome-binding protein aMBF1 (putative translation factor)
MTTHPSTSPVNRGPSDQPFPMGHYPPRRTLPPDLAAVLWSARESSGLSNREIAERAGIDPSYLSKLVRGSRCPSLVTVERLVAVLPLTPDEQAALRDAAVADRGKSRPRR